MIPKLLLSLAIAGTLVLFVLLLETSQSSGPASASAGILRPNDTTSSDTIISTLPETPSSLIAVITIIPAPVKVDLDWSASDVAVDGYAVERAIGAGTGLKFTEIAQVTGAKGAYLDTTINENETYTYRVRAFNTSGMSDYSNTAIAVVATAPPATPSQLKIAAITASTISLSWQDNSTNGHGFYIERSMNKGQTWNRIAQTGFNEKTYFDTGLTPSTSYNYRVQAFNTDGVSQYSEAVSVTTKASTHSRAWMLDYLSIRTPANLLELHR